MLAGACGENVVDLQKSSDRGVVDERRETMFFFACLASVALLNSFSFFLLPLEALLLPV